MNTRTNFSYLTRTATLARAAGARVAMTLLLLLVTTATAWADADLIIRSEADWNTFANNVSNGTDNYAGKVVMLAADISVSTMAGDGRNNWFYGTFDGCGHTLTINLTGGYSGTALFRRIYNATIKNLNVTGTITTTYGMAGSIAFVTNGTTHISNCLSTVSITGNGKNTDGGLVSCNNGELHFTNCAFKGKMLGNDSGCGGFVGWNNIKVVYNSCLFAPLQVTMSTNNSATFNRDASDATSTFNSCYYTQAFGTVQGTSASGMSNETLVSNLGSGWEVSGNNVVPKMINSLDSYLAYNTSTHDYEILTANSYTVVTSSTTTMGAAGTETWYMVSSNVTISSRITVNGTVHLILCDGATLTASQGITVSSGNTLNIYGQTAGTGALNATGVKVGGDGTEAAAIGSVGILANVFGSVNIHGGHITADGAGWSAGIGGGVNGGGGSVAIYGGTVNATGHDGTAEAIGCGSSGADVSKTLADGLRVTTNNNSTPVAYSNRVSSLSEKIVTVEPCTSHNLNNNVCTYCGLTITSFTTTMGAAGTETWYKVNSTATANSRIEVAGTVNLILCDGKTLTASQGVHVPSGATLNIYGESGGTGRLIATWSGEDNAGIGCNGWEVSGGNITIHGGNVTASSGGYAAGIGGGYEGSGGTVTIYGGTVTATSGQLGAGIGGGYKGNGGTVIITGGNVTASSGGHAAGIGGGYEGSGGTVTIYGGTVTATSGNYGAGIGGGYQGNGGSITITGGTVNATGGSLGAGIGGGCYRSSGTITITGGTVMATTGENAQAIGNGNSPQDAEGTLTLGDMKAYTSANATTPVAAANRISTCRSTYAKLMPCTAHNMENYVCTYCGYALYHVTYDGNGATNGTVPTDANDYESGQTVTVLDNTGSLARAGYNFGGWNTQADGSGTDYAPGATFAISGNTALYAKWEVGQLELANGADNGTNISLASGDGMYYDVTLADRKLYKDGDWNTLCLPFALASFTGTPLAGATVKTLTSSSFNDGTLTMTFSDNLTSIAPGVPYIVKWQPVDLSKLTVNYTAQDGDVLTGTLGGNYKISIADGATVTLNGVTINGTNSESYKWAGINCEGDATIILSGTNTVKGFYEDYPGIYVPSGKTLTIQGDGSLDASSNGWGAGIGGGYEINCGNITIAGGTVTATGGHAAGIGAGTDATIGNILITGGTVTATGDYYDCAGIGSGYEGSCGTITITDGVTSVTATKGSNAPNSIGKGNSGSCGTVTIGGTVGAISTSPYTYTGTGSASVSGNNIVNPVFRYVTISNTTANVTTTYVDFVGTYSPVVIYESGDKHNLYLGSGNDIYYPSRSGYEVKACRAYFRLKNNLTAGTPNAEVRAFVLNFGEDSETGETTSLNDKVQMINDKEADAWYDLSGRKLSGVGAGPVPARLPKGVYINNGRKVVIK